MARGGRLVISGSWGGNCGETARKVVTATGVLRGPSCGTLETNEGCRGLIDRLGPHEAVECCRFLIAEFPVHEVELGVKVAGSRPIALERDR